MSDYYFANSQLKPNPVISMSQSPENNIIFYVEEQELLRICQDGFYVRGVRVEHDDNEAATVYKAFKQFLVETALRNS